MRQYLWKLLLLVAALTGLGLYLYHNQDYITKFPIEKQVALHHPSQAAADGKGNWYIIEDAKQSILKLGQDGTQLAKIKAPLASEFVSLTSKDPTLKNDDRTYLTYDQVLPAPDGTLYAVVRLMDINALTLKHEAVVRYSAEGELDPSWVGYSRPYSVAEQGSLRGGTIRSLAFKENKLFMITQESDVELDLHEWDDKLDRFSKITSTHIPSESGVADISGVKSQELIYATKKGEIYYASERIYPQTRTGQNGIFADHVQVVGNDVYFLDEYGSSVKRFSSGNPAKVETLFTQQDAAAKLVSGPEAKVALSDAPLESLGVAPDGTVFVALGRHAVQLMSGRELQVLEYSGSTRTQQYLIWAAFAVAAVLLIWLFKILYVNIMPHSLIYKQLFVLIPLISLSMLSLALLVHTDFRADTELEVRRALTYLAHDGQNLVDAERLLKIDSPQDFMNEDYKALKEKLSFKDNYGKFYMMIYKYVDRRLYDVLEDDNDVRMFDSFEVSVHDTAVSACMVRDKYTSEFLEVDASFDYSKALEEQTFVTCKSQDENGTWLFALGPLYNAEKTKVVGIYEAGINTHALDARMKTNWNDTLKQLTGFAILILIVVLVVTLLLLKSVRNLSVSANQIAKGQWNTRVKVSSQDEVAALGHTFNNMSEEVEKKVLELREFRDAYRHFVPEEFLNYLGKRDIRHVNLGDQVELDMSILVTNIRHFDDFMEDMKDKTRDNFNFINRFLHEVSPIVDQNNGEVSKYLNHGILAVFPNSPGEALRAAVEMKRALDRYNSHRAGKGKARIDVGIGIQQGPLMLGIIGAEERLEVNVISDSVQFAMVLEEISDKLGATILLPARVLQQIPERDRFQARSLGKLQLQGSLSGPIELYDVFEADDEETRRLKQKTKDLFESAITKYQQGRFYDAREAFLQVIRQNPGDKIAQLYFYVCDEYRSGMKDDWKGTLDV
ncbi:class 3 adenylate cyclase [Tumebacillus sp. BK434]|uniref:adenylate/guanylate cyclase domain-containing protein n=1 Tax=Tumebacillus sp. BK434 TaxID=2512169 RepID=UPI001045E534|nr:adenylate/guanylate cyclase domain-containing protein [Tumebacillus sp. BK434]TCP59016.1 class 3 adenylate cyclase [Tumebacillus sp. BK434]